MNTKQSKAGKRTRIGPLLRRRPRLSQFELQQREDEVYITQKLATQEVLLPEDTGLAGVIPLKEAPGSGVIDGR